jgi:23S rRNA (adenine2503-C2)-methyltransferase
MQSTFPASPEAEATQVPARSAAIENLFGLDVKRLQLLCVEWGEPPYRARQLSRWLYRRRVFSLDAMTDLGRELRVRLATVWTVRWPRVAARQSSTDGTVKYLLALGDGATVECVLIPEARRRTLCLSTQVGCPLHCAFCLTGQAGYRRDLTCGEILGQAAVLMAEATASDKPWNIVIMGMGEPLLNVDATLGALRLLMDTDGFGIPPRRVTLSTVGILPGLERLIAEPRRPNLAISLHAAQPELRRRLVPSEAKHPIADVIALVRRYQPPSGGRVTFEYVLLRGVNDAPRDARAVVGRLGDLRAKVNLIPLNAAPGIPFERPTDDAVDAFAHILTEARLAVSVRKPRGQDVLAACGQLRLSSIERPGPFSRQT